MANGNGTISPIFKILLSLFGVMLVAYFSWVTTSIEKIKYDLPEKYVSSRLYAADKIETDEKIHDFVVENKEAHKDIRQEIRDLGDEINKSNELVLAEIMRQSKKIDKLLRD